MKKKQLIAVMVCSLFMSCTVKDQLPKNPKDKEKHEDSRGNVWIYSLAMNRWGLHLRGITVLQATIIPAMACGQMELVGRLMLLQMLMLRLIGHHLSPMLPEKVIAVQNRHLPENLLVVVLVLNHQEDNTMRRNIINLRPDYVSKVENLG